MKFFRARLKFHFDADDVNRNAPIFFGDFVGNFNVIENNNAEEYIGRLKTLAIMFTIVIAILIARVGYLQIYDGEYYAHLADGNRIRIIPSMAPRGTFYDRNGRPYSFQSRRIEYLA